MPDSDDKNLEILDAIFHEAAMAAAENTESTPRDKEWARRVRARLEQQVAQARRNLELADPKPAQPIRPSFLAMARDALLARIEELVLAGKLQVAHRNLDAISDDELRRLLESADPQLD